MKENKLWTRDFTIITIGTLVSMLGSALSNFAIGLLVLDYTESTLYFAIYMVSYTLPQLFAPIISGAILDRFSRKKAIYTMDFLCAALYLVGAAIIGTGHFNFVILIIFAFTMGSISSIYMVAYDSFYPLLISEGCYSKAYSIASVLETMVLVMIPVSAYVYNLIGIVPLLIFDAATFFVAAVMETRISLVEAYVDKQKENRKSDSKIKTVLIDTKEGFQYLWSEKGLLAVAIYFAFISMSGGAQNVVGLPYFRSNYENGEYVYMIVMVWVMIGRALGGGIHYKFTMPKEKKFKIAMTVYFLLCFVEGTYLFYPVPVMAVCMFCAGILGVTSYTIRISATQSYVPDERKGRFNGAFNMLNTLGALIGETLAGVLTLSISPKYAMAGFFGLQFIAAIVLIWGNRKHVAPIYNTEQ